MKLDIAKLIGNKARGIKHCDKILKEVNERGSASMRVGNTGVIIPVVKGDAMHSMISSIRAKLQYEINSIEVTNGLTPSRTLFPVPVGASPDQEEDAVALREELRKQKRKEYNRRYYERKKKEAAKSRGE